MASGAQVLFAYDLRTDTVYVLHADEVAGLSSKVLRHEHAERFDKLDDDLAASQLRPPKV
jgi:hypothetical protein